jgi:hypothetical protein
VHQHKNLSFHLGHELARGRRANPVQECARTFHPTRTLGLFRRSPGGTTLTTRALLVVLVGATLSSPDTSPGAPGAASVESGGKGGVPEPLFVGFSVSLGLFVGAAG